MKLRPRRLTALRFSTAAILMFGFGGIAASVSASGGGRAVRAPTVATPTADGRHDFDFNFGTWHTRIHRVPEPLTAPSKSVGFEGTVTVRKIWGGRAALEEIEAGGPAGRFQGMTVFLYNPTSRQWSQTFASSQQGILQPSLIGSFARGRGELFSQDSVGGKSILVRSVWSDITPDAHRYEESYSDNGGKTWATAFKAALTRDKPAQDMPTLVQVQPPTAGVPGDGRRDFDFDIGTWRTQTSRLLRPLTGSTQWIQMEGVTNVQPVWGGKGNLAILESDGPQGHLSLISVRLYNPKARQWSLSFATVGSGALSQPMIGEFKNGRGEFYVHEEYEDRTIWVRFTFISMSANTARSEQAFSADGGKTWETNFVNRYTRIAG